MKTAKQFKNKDQKVTHFALCSALHLVGAKVVSKARQESWRCLNDKVADCVGVQLRNSTAAVVGVVRVLPLHV